MCDVIKLRTYKFNYDVEVKKGKKSKKDEKKVETLEWFITVKPDCNVEALEKQLTKEYKQPIKLILDDEFELNRPTTKLDPRTDSIYNQEPNEATHEGEVVDMPIELDIGDKVNHPKYGEGEVVDYYATEFKDGTLNNSRTGARPAATFAYVIAFKDDEYDDDNGKHRRPTRKFTPRSLWNAINNPWKPEVVEEEQ